MSFNISEFLFPHLMLDILITMPPDTRISEIVLMGCLFQALVGKDFTEYWVFEKDHKEWTGISVEKNGIGRRQVDDKQVIWGRENSNEQKT